MEMLRFDGVNDRVIIPILQDTSLDWTLEFKITILANADTHILGPLSYANNTYRWFRVNVPAQVISICGTSNSGFTIPCPFEVNETCVIRLESSSNPDVLKLFKNGIELVQTWTTGFDGFDRIGVSGTGQHSAFDLYYLHLTNGTDSRHYSAENITSGNTLPDLINSANNGSLLNFNGNQWLDDALFTAPTTITPGVQFTSTVMTPFVNGSATLDFHGVSVPVTITGGSFSVTMPTFVDGGLYPRIPLNGSLILTQGANTANIFRAIALPANTETLRTPQGVLSNFYDIIADNEEFLGYHFEQENNPLTTADTLYWNNFNGLMFEPESVYDVPAGAVPFSTTIWVRRGSSNRTYSHEFSLSSLEVSLESLTLDFTNWYQQNTAPFFDGLSPLTAR